MRGEHSLRRKEWVETWTGHATTGDRQTPHPKRVQGKKYAATRKEETADHAKEGYQTQASILGQSMIGFS